MSKSEKLRLPKSFKKAVRLAKAYEGQELAMMTGSLEAAMHKIENTYYKGDMPEEHRGYLAQLWRLRHEQRMGGDREAMLDGILRVSEEIDEKIGDSPEFNASSDLLTRWFNKM